MSISREVKTSWRFAAVSFLCIFVAIPIVGLNSIPYSVGYVALPGTIVAVIAACVCAVCFIWCPRKPFIPKIITFILLPLSTWGAIDVVAYYYLHVQDMAGRVILK